MRLLFLGTSAAQPTESRGLSCTCIERNGEIIMFDAGEAAQIAYAKAKLGWNKDMKICITHLHGDHCTGLLGLLQTMSMQGRTRPLNVFGPARLEEFITTNVRILNFGLTFPLSISAVSPGMVVETGQYEIHACRASHSVTAFSYMLREKDRPGRFSVDSAKMLGVPEGPLWRRLQDGDSVSIDGRIVRPEQVLGPKKPGRTVGVSGDTMCSPELEGFYEGCDYLVFDATFLEAERQRAAETRHSTAMQAASLAKAAGVKNLVLTHFSSRYKDESGHLEEARGIHPGTVTARDQMEITIA